jgi:uncharacterized protein YfaA (DUF2138 family)
LSNELLNELLNESDDVVRIAAAKGQVGATLRAIFYAKDRYGKEAIIERLIHEVRRKSLWRRRHFSLLVLAPRGLSELLDPYCVAMV